jgi:hypothetical protein
MLDRLILADGAAKYDTLASIRGCLAQRGTAKTHRFRRDQNTLGVQAVQDIFKAAALLPDAIGRRYRQCLNK